MPSPSELGLYVVVPLILTSWLFYQVYSRRLGAIDFDHAYWPAGMRVIHGLSPYVYDRAQIAGGVAFVYPPAAALLFAPFALVSRGFSSAVFVVLSLAAGAGTLAVLRVRDWRLYGLIFLWPPVVSAWQTGNLTLLLGLGVALAWRFRDRPVVAGAITGVLISMKPLVWPLLLWLVATRRLRATIWGVASAVAINGLALVLLGFTEAGRFVHLTNAVTDALIKSGYGLAAVSVHLGLGKTTGLVAEIVLSGITALCLIAAGRRPNDLLAMTLCVALMLLASPLLWEHYFALLLVPLALARPRLSAAWGVPLLLFACPARAAGTWQELVWWAGVVALLLAVVGPGRSERSRVWRANARPAVSGTVI